MTDIKQSIKQHISKNILFSGQDLTIDDDGSFLEQGVIDSLGFMELVAFVEKEYGVKVAPQDLVPDNFDSVNKLARYINSRKAPASSVS